jgi:hypothetical protein
MNENRDWLLESENICNQLVKINPVPMTDAFTTIEDRGDRFVADSTTELQYRRTSAAEMLSAFADTEAFLDTLNKDDGLYQRRRFYSTILGRYIVGLPDDSDISLRECFEGGIAGLDRFRSSSFNSGDPYTQQAINDVNDLLASRIFAAEV